MKDFNVSIPIAGSMTITVKAENAEQAKEAAWDAYNDSGPDVFEVEWEAHSRITSGNVCHVSLNEVCVDEA